MDEQTLVALDLETALTTGEASVEFYRPDFRIVSCAISYEGHDLFVEGEDDIHTLLEQLAFLQCPIIVHNLQFEYGVISTRFPDISLNWHADTMRLAQVADKGMSGDGDDDTLPGYKLTTVAQRWVTKYQDHKELYYSYLRDQGVKKGKEGAHLHLLPPDMLREYNIADTQATLAIYKSITGYFTKISYDWAFDHFFYINSCKLLSQSRARGIAVDRAALAESIKSLQAETEEIKTAFDTMFKAEIEAIEAEKLEKMLGLLKTEKGREKARIRIQEAGSYKFNLASIVDKTSLFCGKLGITPKFYTDKGGPSFAKEFLGQWGEGGKLLKTRGTLSITTAQCEKLLELSKYDGRWHVDLKAVGTATGRNAGAGGLNAQGLARREKRLMGCLVSDPGQLLCSVDLSAGEPTANTHYSKDTNYRAATFDMVGKEPYYSTDGVLMIDDIYLMGMSVSPMGKKKIKDLFDNGQFDGMPFSKAWVVNPDLIKTALKADRAFHKILILGLGYGMGPKHMTESAHKAGFELSLKDAKAFFREYWTLFSGVKEFGDKLEQRFLSSGHLINEFGYRLLPDPSYKALNYFIQSTVSGIMNALAMKFFTCFPQAQYVTVIHDELIFQIPEDQEERARQRFMECVDSLNNELNWSVKIRTGWVTGRTMYEAK